MMKDIKSTQRYASDYYLPMLNRKMSEATKNVQKDIRDFAKNEKGGWKSYKRIKEYKKKRLQEYDETVWGLQLDILVTIYVSRCQTDKEGHVELHLKAKYDDEGEVTDYDIGDTERGWNAIKEKAYEIYLRRHKDSTEDKETILSKIRKELEMKTLVFLKLLKDHAERKPAFSAQLEVVICDDGKLVMRQDGKDVEIIDDYGKDFVKPPDD